MRLTMGRAVDYIRPRSGLNLCLVLTSNVNYLSSGVEEGPFTPDYDTEVDWVLGGSAQGWPKARLLKQPEGISFKVLCLLFLVFKFMVVWCGVVLWCVVLGGRPLQH